MELLPVIIALMYIVLTLIVRTMLMNEINIDLLKKFFNILVHINFLLFVFYSYNTIYPTYGLGFSFIQSLLLTLLIINIFFLLFMFQKQIYHLGLILFPLTAFVLIMSQSIEDISNTQKVIPEGLQLHILTSFASYGL